MKLIRPAPALALALLGLTLAGPAPLRAAEESSYDQLLREIVNLRLDIEQQRREIRALREEVGQLSSRLEGKPYRKLAPVADTPAVHPSETYAATERDKPAPVEKAPASTKKEAPEQPASSGTANPYRVKAGDTLSSIARTHKVTLDELRTANPGVEPKSLKVGTELKLP